MSLATDSKHSTARFRVGRGVRLQIPVVGETVLAVLCPAIANNDNGHYSLKRCDRDQVSNVPANCMVFGNTAIPVGDDTRPAITAWLLAHDTAVREVC
ncbi:hypothetical protein [Xanthomonas maliensis]|uniref:hypothetical protein n=1 Tax=Xanthomonas maliensis TaxID=1321368 RepID=UPI0003B75BA8|nr:hypothetical protein [Xanthomonas maliensis]KAB7767598.1 hypothetical protein CKY51_11045 [Xanthomonas maliensis]